MCPDDCVYDTDKLYLINNSVLTTKYLCLYIIQVYQYSNEESNISKEACFTFGQCALEDHDRNNIRKQKKSWDVGNKPDTVSLYESPRANP